jgi:hypothetical protein
MRAGAAVLLLAMVAATPEARYFRYQRAVSVPGNGAGQACVAIDPAVYPHAAEGLADLRLYSGGTETPYVLIRPETADAGANEVAPVNLGIRDGAVVFDAEMPEGRYNDLYLTIDAKDYIATVAVTGSEEKAGKKTQLGRFTIFDLSGQKLGSSTVLHMPESNFRYLHFHIDGPLKPAYVHGFHVGTKPERPPKYMTVAETAKVEQKGKTSVAEFTVPAHVEVDRVTFKAGAAPAQFSRVVSVRTEWQEKSGAENPDAPAVSDSGTIRRVHRMEQGRRIDIDDLSVEMRLAGRDEAAQWKVTIENGDDRPLDLQSVRLEMLERSACFEAESGGQYKLMYGDAALGYPRYDYSALFVKQVEPLQAVATSEEANPQYEARPDDRAFTEKHPGLLWAALVAAIAALGGIALKAYRGGRRSNGLGSNEG